MYKLYKYMFIVQSKWTPLHTAARQGHVKVVQIMINFGADLASTDSVRIYEIRACLWSTVLQLINFVYHVEKMDCFA